MAVREILKMGDPRLLRVAQPVTQFDTPELRSLIVAGLPGQVKEEVHTHAGREYEAS